MSDQAEPLFPHRPLIAALAALIAGVLLPLALAPFDYWWSVFVSIFLLLAVLQGATFRQALLRWYLFGLGQFLLGASWVFVSINTHGGASVLLAATLTGLFVAAIALTTLLQGYVYHRFFAFQSVWMVTFPGVWFVKEWTMTWALSAGFPWALAGYSQLFTPLAGYAPVIGVLGLGFVIALVASLMFAGVVRVSGLRFSWWGGVAGIFLIGFGLSQLNHTEASGEPMSVSLVQGNIAQETKWRREMVQPIIQTYSGYSHTEWGQDLIVWPEAAITLFEDSAGTVLDYLGARGKASDTSLLLGIPSRDDEAYYNSAVVVGAGSGKYTKRHLVPFGEYVPFEDYLRGVIQFFDLPMSHNKPGDSDQALLRAGSTPVALSICYEIAFPNLVRGDAAAAGLLVTISNDTWFGESLGPHQHMQMAQMRALENGRYLLRATNNGITAAVDPKGRMIARLPQFEPGVLRAVVEPMGGVTPYTRLGDWPLLVSLFLLFGYLLLRPAGSDTADVLQ